MVDGVVRFYGGSFIVDPGQSRLYYCHACGTSGAVTELIVYPGSPQHGASAVAVLNIPMVAA